MEERNWHALENDLVIHSLRTDRFQGLTGKEVKHRLDTIGFNELIEKPKASVWKMLAEQFEDFMVLVLLGATLVSAFLGEYSDAITIMAIVVTNAILGFVQEFKAEKSMEALKQLTAPTSRVIRGGIEQRISARELVPGDLIILEAGDRLAADGRLVEAINLEVEESALTGESVPVRKNADKLFAPETGLGDRRNMVYVGTSVTRGRGLAAIIATGMSTEMGRIAGMIQEVEEEDTPLQRRLDQLGKYLVWGCLGVCGVVVATGVLRGESVFLMAMSGISLAVAAIPEGLPAIVTVALALGVQRMIKRNAIVRKLPAVETLGCTTVICSDKTGTLTQNEMTVRKIYTSKGVFLLSGRGYDPRGQFFLGEQEFDPRKDKSVHLALTIGTLCNNSTLVQNGVSVTGLWRKMTGRETQQWCINGDPTEGALVVAGAKASLWRDQLEKEQMRIAENPFESDRKRMSVVYKNQAGSKMVYVKGAPDTILDLCSHIYENGKEVPLTAEWRAKIVATNDEMANDALRVLGTAYKRLSDNAADFTCDEIERNLVFVGLAGMIDPPREEVKHAIEVCKCAGIKTAMITGDHKNTALAIAKELNMVDEEGKAITGAELECLSDAELEKISNSILVYARVSPTHKLRIVRALKRAGHIVAMTGDGVNDAPAIKEADIGIAMGKTGTEVTKEASAMVLADDNFATIVAAVEEGRGIYDNIRKFIRYLLACNIGEVLTMFLAALAGLPLPILPIQILWVNLVTDGLPAMALGVEPTDRDIMYRAPRHPQESIFSRGLKNKIIWRGVQIGISTVGIFVATLYLKGDLAFARTMAFTTLVISQLIYVFDCKSETRSIYDTNLFNNIYLVAAVLCSFMMQVCVLYVPFFQSCFNTVPLTVTDWGMVFLVAGWTFIVGYGRRILFGYSPKRVLYNKYNV
jgi:P-type Ca2+ transporter type 2C